MPQTDVAQATGKTVSDVGQVFAQGQTDGLILYALILATFLMFLVAVALIWSHGRERRAADVACVHQARDFAEAAKSTAEALKELATAVASSGSADMAFKQAAQSKMDRVEILLVVLEQRIGIAK